MSPSTRNSIAADVEPIHSAERDQREPLPSTLESRNAKSYDPKCFDLAEYFLRGSGHESPVRTRARG